MPKIPTLKQRLNRALKTLEKIHDSVEHKAYCPLWDRRHVETPLCRCWKREVTRLLRQEGRQVDY